MIVVMKRGAEKAQVKHVIEKIENAKLKPVPLYGTERTVIAVIGDERVLQVESLAVLSGVEKVMPVLKPYKLVSREFKKENTVVRVGDVSIGGNGIVIMAGPCTVEGRDLILKTAEAVKAAGAKILRGGAFKPRTSPHDFQGPGEEGLKHLAEAREKTGLLIVTEVMDTRDVELVASYADILQIGTRNMQNFELLKAVGKIKKPVLLKRGMCATYKEFLLAAEYIIAEGNHDVILCERGVRTFETHTRNTLDLAAVPAIKELSHLPVVVDPSHGTGKWSLVAPMSKAAVAAGADGLIIEVHPDPENAVTDADQTISTERFSRLMAELRPVAGAVGRKIC
ncbi:MAG: 3-deoxy-7-phosphoheptulonate synthase [archaeon]